jgi:tRNA(Ile)-lysidine synthase
MIIDSVNAFIKKHSLIPDKSTIIVGLSGGPDSVFLVHFLHGIKDVYKIDIIAAHLDHEWRTNSAHDVAFCATLCQKLGITFVSKKASELNIIIKRNGSQEELGRMLRRYFLEAVRKEYNAEAIALAHHKQDQQETFFIRLIRGATLTGLTGMHPKSVYYIRPLLEISKAAIVSFLNSHNLEYLVDPTNLSENYLRNRIRLKVVPALLETDLRFDANFLRTMSSLQETELFLNNLTVTTYKSLEVIENSISYLNLTGLLETDLFLQKRVVIYWLITCKVPFTPTEALVSEILRFLINKKSNKHMLHTTWEVVKKDNKVFINKI